MNHTQLPEGYRLLQTVDLQKDTKKMLLINGACLGIAMLMVIAALFFVPFSLGETPERGSVTVTLWAVVLLAVAIILYVVLHEAVHGICMKAFSGQKARYGFTGPYAYAASDVYFCKRDYIIIALAPVVIWGIVLLAASIIVPPAWFWFVYLIQVMNISGAAGDIYMTYLMTKSPADVLVRDAGVMVEVFSQ